MQGWADQGGSSTRRGMTMQAAEEDDGLCFRCGEAGHQAASCRVLMSRLMLGVWQTGAQVSRLLEGAPSALSQIG
jgi:hypothetical protein